MPLPLTITLIALAFIAAIFGAEIVAYIAVSSAVVNESARMFTLAPRETRPTPPGVRQRTPYVAPEDD